MLVREAIGRELHRLGVRTAFGVVGSGNFHVTGALVAAGARFVAARHEGGAAVMADAHARTSGEVTVLSVHQGCGYTNSLTGVAEAAKSRTPLLVVTAEATERTSNFYVDQPAIAEGVGAVSARVRSARTALDDVTRAFRLCAEERRTVVLNVPIDVQDEALPEDAVAPRRRPAPGLPRPAAADAEDFAELLRRAERPVFVAGRGARSGEAGEAIAALASRTGALLATSAVARGLFNGRQGEEWCLDVAGGFSTPLAAELISGADLIVGWGCALNMWTMRHGRLISDTAKVVQVDVDRDALGRTRDIDLGMWGGVTETAREVAALLADDPAASRYRTPDVAKRLAAEGRWPQVPFEDGTGDGRIDPRALTLTLNDMLPAERTVAVDSGNFMGYPSMYLDVPDQYGLCFTQAFQSIGLGLSTAIGAALARPERLPVAACGDGGFLMGVSELETAVRLGLPLLVVVYNDAMYGAEVHHFGHPTEAADLSTVTFPDTDIAALARGHGCAALTVTAPEDLSPLAEWLAAPDRPMVIDAKTTRDEGSWWLQEAFGH
ncbi:thiamine pyrophosphate-binding protein [Streptomyces sp. NBC_00006]|uniref:thiamine pyrophosphate-binding protein n=1 Tax=unclassified Streptomyces TaxID=2593676 RepID=UPI0022582D76|nr:MULTISPECIES: thiamine pyrophosphate-binding protein [unclassified Streptomyces]MCX5537010.1 thiamine pyrophosphate-binding protein [Streptomyces sp. NBC_00006]